MAGFINIGFGNIVNRDKIVAVVSPDAAPVKRMVQQGKEEKIVIDATQGRRTKAVLVTQEGFLVLSALQPDTIGKRLHAEKIIEEKGWIQISDESAIKEVVLKILEANPSSIADYKAGKDRALGFLVGQAMKETKGKANPQMLNKMFLEELKK